MKYYAYNALHRRYAEHMTEVSISEHTRGIIALDEYNCPQGIILFDQFTEAACMAHISIGSPMALRGIHIEAFKYVFEQLDKCMIIGVVAGNNAKALKLNAHFGFTEIARIKDAYDVGVDQVVIQMLREDCKYINQLKKVA